LLRSYANSKLAQIYHARALYQKIYHQIQQQHEKQPVSNDSIHLVSEWKRIPRIISFCPGWVGPNIGGPNDSMATNILARIAYPVQGWGIASALHSILSIKSDDNNVETNSSRIVNDYYINSKAFLIAKYIFPISTPSWFYTCGFRDVISNMFANVA
jgi:hypothetical protein